MKKPIINTLLYRKADRYEPHRCVVEKAVAIPHTEFEQMRLHPVRDSTYIKEYKDLMTIRITAFCSLMRSVVTVCWCRLRAMIMVFRCG